MNVRHLDWEANKPCIEIPADLRWYLGDLTIEPVHMEPGQERVLSSTGMHFYYVVNGGFQLGGTPSQDVLRDGDFGGSDIKELPIRNVGRIDARMLRLHLLDETKTGVSFHTDNVDDVPNADSTDTLLGFNQQRLWDACPYLPPGIDVSHYDIRDGCALITSGNPVFFYVIGGGGKVLYDRDQETRVERRDYAFSDTGVVTLTGCMTALVIKL